MYEEIREHYPEGHPGLACLDELKKSVMPAWGPPQKRSVGLWFHAVKYFFDEDDRPALWPAFLWDVDEDNARSVPINASDPQYAELVTCFFPEGDAPALRLESLWQVGDRLTAWWNPALALIPPTRDPGLALLARGLMISALFPGEIVLRPEDPPDDLPDDVPSRSPGTIARAAVMAEDLGERLFHSVRSVRDTHEKLRIGMKTFDDAGLLWRRSYAVGLVDRWWSACANLR